MKSSSVIVGGFSSARYLRNEYAARLSFMCGFPFRRIGAAAGLEAGIIPAASSAPAPAAAVRMKSRRETGNLSSPAGSWVGDEGLGQAAILQVDLSECISFSPDVIRQ